MWELFTVQSDFENGLFNDRGKWSYRDSYHVSHTEMLWLLNFNTFGARKIEISEEEKSQRAKRREMKPAWEWGSGSWGCHEALAPCPLSCKGDRCALNHCGPNREVGYAFEKWRKLLKLRGKYRAKAVNSQLFRGGCWTWEWSRLCLSSSSFPACWQIHCSQALYADGEQPCT